VSSKCTTVVVTLFQAVSVMSYFGLFGLDFLLFYYFKIGNGYICNTCMAMTGD